MSEKRGIKYRGQAVPRPKPKCKPEPSLESRTKNRPELQERIHAERRARLLALAPAGAIRVPAEEPKGSPADPAANAPSLAGDQGLPVQVVSDPSGDGPGPVEPVVEDASVGVVGGAGEPEAPEGDAGQVADEAGRDVE